MKLAKLSSKVQKKVQYLLNSGTNINSTQKSTLRKKMETKAK
jgi:hypothetical protein